MVNIDIDRITDSISENLREYLSKNPYGKVVDYKITDGTSIGLVIKLKNGKKIWFFEKEIEGYQLEENFELSSSLTIEQNIDLHRKDLLYVLNPLNLVNWLMYSLKDIY